MIKVSPESCQRWLYKKSACSLCETSCPVEGCISLHSGAPVADEEKCTSCGVCTTECPTGAITLDGLTDSELSVRLGEAREEHGDTLKLHLGCYISPETAAAIEDGANIKVPCLALLKESHLIELVAAGVEELSMDLTGCNECSIHTGKDSIERTVRFATKVLEKLALGGRVTMLHEPVPVGETRRSKRPWREIRPGPVYSRREMFSLLKDKAAVAVATAGKDDEADAEYTAPGMTERRRIFIDALGVIKNKGGDGSGDGEVKELRVNEGAFPAHNIGILEGCTFCDACDAFCPTGAIKKVENDDNGAVSYEFHGANCVGCYECRELCPEGAIYYKGEIEVGRFVDAGAETLIMRQRKRCSVCGIVYVQASGKDDCPRCIRRKSLDKRVRETIFGA